MNPDIHYLTQVRGFRVFPIRAGSKTPITKGWPVRATSDLEAARALWREAGISSGDPFNAGIVTDGLVVVDIDKFPPTWKDLRTPQTFRVRTHQGEHWYFTGTNIKPAPLIVGEVDIKAGPGAMVLAPGSTHHTGTVYTIIDDTPPSPLPRWLATAIKDAGLFRSAIPGPDLMTPPGDELEEDVEVFVNAVRSQLNTLGERGDRNRSLFRFACCVYRDWACRWITTSTRNGLLVEAGDILIAADFTTDEFMTVVNSAWRSVFGGAGE